LDIIADGARHRKPGKPRYKQIDMKLNIIKWLKELNPKQKQKVLARRFGFTWAHEPSNLRGCRYLEIGLNKRKAVRPKFKVGSLKKRLGKILCAIMSLI